MVTDRIEYILFDKLTNKPAAKFVCHPPVEVLARVANCDNLVLFKIVPDKEILEQLTCVDGKYI